MKRELVGLCIPAVLILLLGPRCTVTGDVETLDFPASSAIAAEVNAHRGLVGTEIWGTANTHYSTRDLVGVIAKSGISGGLAVSEPVQLTSSELAFSGLVDAPAEGDFARNNLGLFSVDLTNAIESDGGSGFEDVGLSVQLRQDDGELWEHETQNATATFTSTRIRITSQDDLPPVNGQVSQSAELAITVAGDGVNLDDPTQVSVNDVSFSSPGTTFTLLFGDTLVRVRMRERTIALRLELNPGAIEGLFHPTGPFDFTVVEEIPFGARHKTVIGMPTRTLGMLDLGGAALAATATASLLPEGSPDSAGTTPAGLPAITKTFYISFLLNSSVIAHLPFGEISPIAITSQMIVNNPYSETVDGVISLLNTTDGLPVEAVIDGTNASSHGFSIGPLESRVFEIDPTGVNPPQVAWASVRATRNLSVAANFVTLDASSSAATSPEGTVSGSILAEAGIAASDPGFVHVLNVFRQGPVDTGFAILNPTGGLAEITLRLKEDPAVGSRLFRTSLSLSPRRQRALFVGELFSELEPGPFNGTLEIKADTSMVVISLKTLNGLQSSSLPSGTP